MNPQEQLENQQEALRVRLNLDHSDHMPSSSRHHGNQM